LVYFRLHYVGNPIFRRKEWLSEFPHYSYKEDAVVVALKDIQEKDDIIETYRYIYYEKGGKLQELRKCSFNIT